MGNEKQRVHAVVVVRAAQLQGKGKTQIGNEGKRVRRVNCQRCEHRQNLIEKIAFQPAYLFGRKLMLLMHENTSIAQIGEQIGKRFLLIIHQRIGNLGHTLQLLGGGQVILAFNLDACI